MKRWKWIAFIVLLLVNAVVVSYAYQNSQFRSSDAHAGFPIAKSAERIERTEGLTIYTWDKAKQDQGLPLGYRLIIWQRGWEKTNDQGPTTFYRKGNHEVMITVLNNEISLHDVPEAEGE